MDKQREEGHLRKGWSFLRPLAAAGLLAVIGIVGIAGIEAAVGYIHAVADVADVAMPADLLVVPLGVFLVALVLTSTAQAAGCRASQVTFGLLVVFSYLAVSAIQRGLLGASWEMLVFVSRDALHLGEPWLLAALGLGYASGAILGTSARGTIWAAAKVLAGLTAAAQLFAVISLVFAVDVQQSSMWADRLNNQAQETRQEQPRPAPPPASPRLPPLPERR